MGAQSQTRASVGYLQPEGFARQSLPLPPSEADQMRGCEELGTPSPLDQLLRPHCALWTHPPKATGWPYGYPFIHGAPMNSLKDLGGADEEWHSSSGVYPLPALSKPTAFQSP